MKGLAARRRAVIDTKNDAHSASKHLKLARLRTNNSPASHLAKTDIRTRVAQAIGWDRCHVFDAFAGDGAMYREVWRKAASYTGCDLVYYPDERLAFVADNVRVMRCIDLGGFTVVDLDAHGSPWEQVVILCARRPQLQAGQRLGVILTEGASLKTRLGGSINALAELAGISPTMRWSHQIHGPAIERGICAMARRLDATVVHRWEARRKVGAQVRYIGLVLEGKKKAPPVKARPSSQQKPPATRRHRAAGKSAG